MSVASTNKYGYAYGIYARTEGADSGIYSIANSGTLVVTGAGTDGARAIGIFARTNSSDSPIGIVNSGDITVTATVETGTYAASAFGILRVHMAATVPSESKTQAISPSPQPRPAMTAVPTALLRGQSGPAAPSESRTQATSPSPQPRPDGDARAYGIAARADGSGSSIGIENSGDITATAIFTAALTAFLPSPSAP
jgi:hypothetical protein